MVAFACQPAEPYVTLEEYERIEAETGLKHEWFNGHVWAMAGGSRTHNIISVNISTHLSNQLADSSVVPFGSDQRIRVPQTGLRAYPDISVACPPEEWENEREITLLNPKIIIEVLSPSTANYDRGEKWEHYQELESLTDYLLVSSDCCRVMHYHRQSNDDWLLHIARSAHQTIALESINASLPLEKIYRRVQLAAQLNSNENN